MVAINVNNVSKIYRIGQIGTGSLAHDIERWWRTKILNQPDPFMMLDEMNDLSSKTKSEYIYSLRDISFDINQGDAVGIIGKNGAGKSTLLKILSRVTTPTKGHTGIKGRIASLLEVGTGFHPELTGMENIYLNGAILGMRKKEIDQKIEEIIDFSGVERYINTPVKRYSSGMYVRLAFSVAAHLESEIMMVDEVLAVGDVDFQKKCINKMDSVSRKEGRTVLFVSHNMASLQNLCNTSILLEQGKLIEYDKSNIVINNYLKRKKQSALTEIKSIQLQNVLLQHIGFNYNYDDDIRIKQGENILFTFDIINSSESDEDIIFNIEIKSNDGIPVTCFGNEFQYHKLVAKQNSKQKVTLELGECNWKKGSYSISFYFQLGNEIIKEKVYIEDACNINVLPFAIANTKWNKYIDNYQHGHIPLESKKITLQDI